MKTLLCLLAALAVSACSSDANNSQANGRTNNQTTLNSGICAEGNGTACMCDDGTAGTRDCGGFCVCGCSADEGQACPCGDGSAGSIGCDGTCGACLFLPADMGSPDAAIDMAPGADMGDDMPVDMSAPEGRVRIPAGSFTMGCFVCAPDEGPEHEVMLSEYFLDVTEVSQAAFQTCVDAGACVAPISDYDPAGSGTLPVVSVTFAQAEAYCAWAGGRLPTEAEWERACTGGDDRIYPWGDAAPTCDLANIAGCGAGGSNAVGPVDGQPAGATPEGALNMSGNVWEYTADWYADDAYASHEPTNPTGPATGMYRVHRGGSSGNNGSIARCRNRANAYNPDVGGSGLGFRCAY